MSVTRLTLKPQSSNMYLAVGYARSSEAVRRCIRCVSFCICLPEDGCQLELSDDTVRVVSEVPIERLKSASCVGKETND